MYNFILLILAALSYRAWTSNFSYLIAARKFNLLIFNLLLWQSKNMFNVIIFSYLNYIVISIYRYIYSFLVDFTHPLLYLKGRDFFFVFLIYSSLNIIHQSHQKYQIFRPFKWNVRHSAHRQTAFASIAASFSNRLVCICMLFHLSYSVFKVRRKVQYRSEFLFF